MFPPRGFSVVPPSDGTVACFRYRSGDQYECRRLQGVERLGDPRNFVIGFSSVLKKSDWHNTYGRQLISVNGYIYEGCRQRDSSSYRCDFRTPRRIGSLITNTGASGYAWRVFQQWGTYQRDTHTRCTLPLVFSWVNKAAVLSAADACRKQGPYEGYRP
jgi:hypothetical protein